MALKQSRRSVSLNRSLYRAATAVAAQRGIPLAQLVADSLRAAGVDAPEQAHMDVTTVMHARARRKGVKAAMISPHRVFKRIVQLSSPPHAVESRGGGEVCANRYEAVAYRPSLERRLLGDGVANAMGFR